MVDQYLSVESNGLDHMHMTAGERAMTLLAEYGLVTDNSRHSKWTDDGKLVLKSN